MTEKQKRFADEYIISLNGTEAYMKAYPHIKKPETAAAAASRLLTNVNVKNYIKDRLEEIENKTIAKQEEVLKYLTAVMRGETLSEVVVVEGEGEGYSTARRVDKAPDERERLKAAELLGKRYGLYTDKVDMTQALTIVFEDDYGDSA